MADRYYQGEMEGVRVSRVEIILDKVWMEDGDYLRQGRSIRMMLDEMVVSGIKDGN